MKKVVVVIERILAVALVFIFQIKKIDNPG